MGSGTTVNIIIWMTVDLCLYSNVKESSNLSKQIIARMSRGALGNLVSCSTITPRMQRSDEFNECKLIEPARVYKCVACLFQEFF